MHLESPCICTADPADLELLRTLICKETSFSDKPMQFYGYVLPLKKLTKNHPKNQWLEKDAITHWNSFCFFFALGDMLIFGRYIISGYVSTFLTPHIRMFGYVCHLPNAVIMCIILYRWCPPHCVSKAKGWGWHRQNVQSTKNTRTKQICAVIGAIILSTCWTR